MRLVDTHCHLNFEDYKDDLSECLERARSVGVVRMIVPGTNADGNEKAVALAGEYPEIFAAVGIHPHEAGKIGEADICRLRETAGSGDKVVALGEIGLDYYRQISNPDAQKKLFRGCLRIAKDLDLPVMLHTRDAGEDFLNILKDVSPLDSGGVVHCFSGDAAFLKEILSLGLHVSFAGNITFKKNRDMGDLIKCVPPERLLLETDSPFLAPEPLRGKRNEPERVHLLLDIYAPLYGLSTGDIARITTHNANRLFRLGIEEKARVAYPIRDALYLNITTRCTNRCTFCTRERSDYVKGHNLKLRVEPTEDEIIRAIGEVTGYSEVVFCGYGEPTIRLNTVKKISAYIKSKGGKTRLVTNGQSDLINKKDTSAELKGLIDRVSVSMNAPDAARYDGLCRSVFGKAAHSAVMNFITACRKQEIEVEVTCLDMAGEAAIGECRNLAEKAGASFRLRKMNVVG